MEKVFVSLTKEVEETDHSGSTKDVWFVEKFVGLEIFDVSNGTNYEEQLKIANETAEKNGCQLRINR